MSASPHDKANAEWELAKFKEFGWDAHIEAFQVLYPTPISEAWRLLGTKPFKATLQEPPIPGDSSAARQGHAAARLSRISGRRRCHRAARLRQLRHAGRLQGARAHGRQRQRQDRHRALRRGWRGLKPRLAQDHGAVGCMIYSDPADDGYGQDADLSFHLILIKSSFCT